MMPRQTIALVSIEVDFINPFDRVSAAQASVSVGHRYSTQLISTSNSVTIESGSTRGLTVHPFGTSSLFSVSVETIHSGPTDALRTAATGATLIALLLSLSSHITLVLFSSFLAFIAALLTLIAFAIDIALYIIVRDKVLRLPDVQVRTVAAPGTTADDPCSIFRSR